MERWAINIDIEGFGRLWDKEEQVLLSLGELMRAIFRVGRKCFLNSSQRLFAHQLGDGFLVASDFREENLESAVTIAVALMQHVAASGRFAKAAIAEGELADIHGCYPSEVQDELCDRTVSLGNGLMTLFTVMGTALIRSVKIAENSPRGPLLTIEISKAHRIPLHIPVRQIENADLLSVDWIHMDTDMLSNIQKSANLTALGSSKLEKMLVEYCAAHSLPEEWISNVDKYLSVCNRA